MIIPLIVAFISAITLILQKYILSTLKVNYKDFNIFVFIFLFIITSFLFPKFGWIKPEAATHFYIIIGISMVIAATLWNILLSQALQKEKLIEFELIQMLQPLFTIFLGSLIFTSERSIYILPAAIVAAAALIIAHIKRHHIMFDKYAKYLLLAVVLMAVEMIFIKILLSVYSPVALYAIRTLFVAVAMWGILRPSFITITFRKSLIIIGTAVLAVIQMVLFYYAVNNEGLIFTTMILILTPVLIYLYSIFISKEKLTFRTGLSFVIIIFCILFASIMGNK